MCDSPARIILALKAKYLVLIPLLVFKKATLIFLALKLVPFIQLTVDLLDLIKLTVALTPKVGKFAILVNWSLKVNIIGLMLYKCVILVPIEPVSFTTQARMGTLSKVPWLKNCH